MRTVVLDVAYCVCAAFSVDGGGARGYEAARVAGGVIVVIHGAREDVERARGEAQLGPKRFCAAHPRNL